MKLVSHTQEVSVCTQSQPVVTTLQPVLWGWCTLPNFQNDSFTNELYATLQTPALHRRDYFDTKFEASKVRMCLHKQVWMSACALHILKGRWKRSTSACTQLGYLFLDVLKPSFSFLLQRRLIKSLSQCQVSGSLSLFTISPSFTSKTAMSLYFFPEASPKPKSILRQIFRPLRQYNCRCFLHVQKREVVWRSFWQP